MKKLVLAMLVAGFSGCGEPKDERNSCDADTAQSPACVSLCDDVCSELAANCGADASACSQACNRTYVCPGETLDQDAAICESESAKYEGLSCTDLCAAIEGSDYSFESGCEG